MDQVTDAAAAFGREATSAAAKVGTFAQRALFKVAEKGAEGIRMTRSALNHIPLGVPLKKVNIRKMFLMKHGDLLAAANVEPEDDVSSDDEVKLSDDQVQEKVGKQYFDKAYDAVRAELMQMEEGEDVTTLDKLEEAVKDRRAKVQLVSTTLKKRLNENHTKFEECIKQICQINDGLLETSTECKGGRRLLVKARDSFVTQGLLVPKNHRRREHLRDLFSVVSAVNELYSKYFTLLNLVEQFQFVEAAKMIISPETRKIREEETLMAIPSLTTVVDAWHNFTMSNTTLLSCIDQCIEDCISAGKFNEARYKNAMEASYLLGDQEKTYMGVAQSLWRSAIQILTKAITDMSTNKMEGAMLDEIAQHIAPEHLLPTFNQLCGKTIDFLFLYSQVARCHIEGQRVVGNSSRHHQQALEYIKPIAKKIGLDMHEKIHMVLQVVDIDHVDVDKALHIFFCVNLLIEATVALGLDAEQMQAARTGVKGPLVQYFGRTFHKNKVDVIASFLVDDSWTADGMALANTRYVKPLSPESYRSEVKFVKAYLADLTVGPSLHDNPFYSAKLLSPQDMSGLFETESYVEAAARNASLVTGRSLMTASGVLVANTMFEYVAKVAVRFPPLATEIIQWCEQLACVYIYSVANTFVSVSRDVPLEQQSDFTLSTRRALVFIQDRCRLAFAPSGGRGMDLIKLAFNQVQGSLSNPAEMFGIEHRLTAVESCFTVLAALRATVGSLSRLLKREPLDEFQQHADMLNEAIDDLLHVIVHRICQAIPLVEGVPEEIGRVRFNGNNIQPSPYTLALANKLVQFVNDLPIQFPRPHLRTIFVRRLVFAIQMNMVRGYAKQAKKLSDMQITHMSVDAKGFAESVEERLGSSMVSLPRYGRDFIFGGYDATDKDKTKWKDWVQKNHTNYSSDVLKLWMSNGDKDRKQEVEEFLVSLGHVEAIPVAQFRVAPDEATTAAAAASAVQPVTA